MYLTHPQIQNIQRYSGVDGALITYIADGTIAVATDGAIYEMDSIGNVIKREEDF